MTTLTVGAGQQFASLGAAVAAAQAGDTIDVSAGTYTNDSVVVSKALTIEGVGGLAHFTATGNIPNGKALIVTQADVTLKNLELSGAVVADGNGAGVRVDAGNLVMSGCYVHNNQDGLLEGAVPGGTVAIGGSEFAANGIGDGYTHNIYVGAIQSLTIDNSFIHDANLGHEVKTRAYATTITNSRLYDNGATASYVVDSPDGGTVTIANSVLQKGANSPNSAIVHFGGEGGPYPASALAFVNDTLVNDRGANAVLVNNQAGAPVSLSGGTVTSLSGAQLDATIVGAAPAAVGEPVLDATSPAVTTSGPDTIVVTVAGDASGGDALFRVTANGAAVGGVMDAGAVAVIGARQSFTLHGSFGANAAVGVTLVNPLGGGSPRDLHVIAVTEDGTALTPTPVLLTAAAPAQTFGGPVAAGPDTLTLTVAEDAYQGDAQFLVTIDGMPVGPVQAATASRALGQSQMLSFHGSFGTGAHALGVNFLNDLYGGTPALDRNLYVLGATYDGATVPNATASLTSNGTATIPIPAKGASGSGGGSGPATHTISIGLAEDAYQGDARAALSLDGAALGGIVTVGASHAGGATQTVTFTGSYAAGAHTLTAAFLNDAYGGPGLDRNLYVTGISVDGVAQPNSAAPLYSAGVQAFGIAVPGAAPAGDDTLVLTLSEDAYQGDARFIAYVDGVAQGPAQAVTASHAVGGAQAFTFAGRFGAGPHAVQVDFLNDAYGYAPTLDRNLYVDAVRFDGTAYADSGALNRTSGAAMTVGGGTDPAKSTFAIVPPHG